MLTSADRRLALVHGVDLLVGERLSTLVLQDLRELVLGDEARVGLVEHLEGSDDGLLGVST